MKKNVAVVILIVLILLLIASMALTVQSRLAMNNLQQILTKTEQDLNLELNKEPPPSPPPILRFRAIPRPEHPAPDFDDSQCLKLPVGMKNYKPRAGILIDLNRRRILWEYNSIQGVPIASMTKLLTIYTAFEEIEDRKDLSLESLVTASRETTTAAPVRINLKPGEKYTLHEIFMCAMLKSANDAALLIAEYFGNGRSENFIAKMNAKAREIGMTQASFVNANGLPIYGKQPEDVKMNKASCRDMALLIERLYDYPMILRYTGCKKTETRLGTLQNGNQLLGTVPGMEGLKTGYTQAAGHCLAFSCSRNGRRIIGVVTGFQKRPECFEFCRKLLEWGFAQQ